MKRANDSAKSNIGPFNISGVLKVAKFSNADRAMVVRLFPAIHQLKRPNAPMPPIAPKIHIAIMFLSDEIPNSA
jgi:hypothetical protein